MSGLSKLGTALTIIFVISLVAILAELFYVLWRRRVFHRQAPRQANMREGASADTNSQTFSDSSSTFTSFSSYSKELLYFYFCLNSSRISRVEPNSAPTSLNSGSCADDEMVEVIDVFKLQNMYRPSRFLFTIKEEDRENDVEYYAEKGKSLSSSSAEKGTCNNDNNNNNNDKNDSVKLEEYLKAADEEEYSSVTVLHLEEEETAVSVRNDNDHAIKREGECATATSPFSSPCGSPLYYTPSASPEN